MGNPLGSTFSTEVKAVDSPRHDVGGAHIAAPLVAMNRAAKMPGMHTE